MGPRAAGRPRHLHAIIEGSDNSVCLLASLVAFACDEHDIAWVRMLYGPLDCPCAVTDVVEFDPLAHGLPGAVEHGGANAFRGLRAWVVVSDNDDVGVLSGYHPHSRPLVPVPVTTATEHNENAARLNLSYRSDSGQCSCQCLFGVRIVHEQCDVIVGYPFHAPGNASGVSDAAADRRCIKTGLEQHRLSEGCIRHIER